MTRAYPSSSNSSSSSTYKFQYLTRDAPYVRADPKILLVARPALRHHS